MKKLIILIILLTGQNLYSQSLKLTHPTGGEKFRIGSDTLITWEGVPETEPIKIEFSNDNGLTWQLLTNSAIGLKYNWENIPNLPSDECMIRIQKLIFHDINYEPQGIEWERSFGGTSEDRATSIEQTGDGGYIVAGYSRSSNGDVTESKGSRDYWILKLSSNGAIEWEKSFGGKGWEEAHSITQTNDGGYIVAGFTNSIDGDVSVHKGSYDYWILKLSSDGDIEWEKSYGGSNSESASCIQQANDGGYVVVGYSSSLNGDVSENKGLHDYWILKLSSAGELEWEKSFGGSDLEYATSIRQTEDGGYIVAAISQSSDGDVSKNQGGWDYWILKLSSSGELEWEKSYGGSDYDHVRSILQTDDGGYIVAGATKSSDGDISKKHGNTRSDAWIVKLNAVGELEWEKSYGGKDDDAADCIKKSYDGGYVFSGSTSSRGDDVRKNNGKSDHWIVKINSTGDLIWEKILGGSDYEFSSTIQQTNDRGYIIAGEASSKNGDISDHKGNLDYWIVKLYPDENPVIQSDSSGLFSIEKPLPTENTLKLIYPKGGEKFLIGSDTVITWEGISKTEPVKLEFSSDNGRTWQTIANSATGLEYNWSDIPTPQSDECIVRVRQLKNNDVNFEPHGIEWDKSYGGLRDDHAFSIQQTKYGGYIVTGITEVNEGDAGENSGRLIFDYWIIKLNPDGELEWEKNYGGSDIDQSFSIRQTNDGGYIVAGWASSSNGDVSAPKGSDDYWILKLTPYGLIEWEKNYGGSWSDRAHSVKQTVDGGYIVAVYSSSLDGDISKNNGGFDYWIIKLNSSGGMEWEKSYGGIYTDDAKSVQQTVDGGYVVAGYTNSNDGDVSGNKGGADYWIIKLNSDGELEWEQNYGGSESEFAQTIQQTNDGGYIVAGTTSSVDGDVNDNNEWHNYWIIKLNSDGELEWEKSYGGSGEDYAQSIQQTNDGGYIVAGSSNSVDGDVNGNNGWEDYWVIKLSPNGELDWEKCYGSFTGDKASAIYNTNDGGYVVAGSTWASDSEESISKRNANYWIVKLYPDENPVLQSDSSGLFSIENPSNVERLPIASNTAGINSITPNPADNKINISVTIAESVQTSIAIYNIEGEKVSEIYAGEVTTFGTYEFTSDISKLSNGTYYVIFQTPTVKDSKSIMIVR